MPTQDFVSRLPNDIGGFEAGSVQRVEHVLEPWGKRCHALADVLDFKKLIPHRAWVDGPSDADRGRHLDFDGEVSTPKRSATRPSRLSRGGHDPDKEMSERR